MPPTPIESPPQDVTSGIIMGSFSAAVLAIPQLAQIAAPDDFWLRFRFDALVRDWKRDTRYTSSLTKIVMHPAYQAIIGMGKPALPFIFAELQRNGGHWFWALHAITQEDPAQDSDDFETAAHAWLAWGRAHGYL